MTDEDILKNIKLVHSIVKRDLLSFNKVRKNKFSGLEFGRPINLYGNFRKTNGTVLRVTNLN